MAKAKGAPNPLKMKENTTYPQNMGSLNEDRTVMGNSRPTLEAWPFGVQMRERRLRTAPDANLSCVNQHAYTRVIKPSSNHGLVQLPCFCRRRNTMT